VKGFVKDTIFRSVRIVIIVLSKKEKLLVLYMGIELQDPRSSEEILTPRMSNRFADPGG
jgi:hypothetical protein